MTDIETALRAVYEKWMHDEGMPGWTWEVGVTPERARLLIALASLVQGMVDEKEGQRQAWEDTAAQAYRNTDYYRSLVREIGLMLGSAAYVADDGTVNDDILCAKVPELIRTTLAEQAREIERLRGALQEAKDYFVRLNHRSVVRGETLPPIELQTMCEEEVAVIDAVLRATPEAGG